MTYVFDIDGTLSLVGDRLECLERKPKDWNEFYGRCGEDEANTPIATLCRQLMWATYPGEPNPEIILLTGRRESVRLQTKSWLCQNKLDIYKHLLMRPDKDFRHDTVVKPKLLTEAGVVSGPDVLIFEDRASMVKKWRELGFACCQVAEGEF